MKNLEMFPLKHENTREYRHDYVKVCYIFLTSMNGISVLSEKFLWNNQGITKKFFCKQLNTEILQRTILRLLCRLFFENLAWEQICILGQPFSQLKL